MPTRTFLVYAALTLSCLGGAPWGAELVRSPDAPHITRLVAGTLCSLALWPAIA